MCRHYRGKKFMSSRFQLCVTVCLTARPTSYYWKVADSAAGPDGYSPSAYSYKNSQTEKPTYQDVTGRLRGEGRHHFAGSQDEGPTGPGLNLGDDQGRSWKPTRSPTLVRRGRRRNT
jgi:hypothetical protein